jgi:hypothetical protein
MSRIGLTALSIAFVGSALASPVLADEGSCATRETIVDYLAREYAEHPVAMGLANSGGVIEVLTNAAGTSWTILLTKPDGETCMVAAGEGWESLPMGALAGSGPEA